MPIYEFRCRDCGATFDFLVRTGQDVVSCPSCGATLLEKQISAPAPIRSGRGREDGHTCCGREERCERPPCADDGHCRRG